MTLIAERITPCILGVVRMTSRAVCPLRFLSREALTRKKVFLSRGNAQMGGIHAWTNATEVI